MHSQAFAMGDCALGVWLTALGSLPSGSQVDSADQRETKRPVCFPPAEISAPAASGLCLSPGPVTVPSTLLHSHATLGLFSTRPPPITLR